MGSDNSGKSSRQARLLVPVVAAMVLILGAVTFFMGESPNQVVTTTELDTCAP